MANLGISDSQKTARLHHGPKRHTLYDMVPEPSEAPYLGSLPVITRIEARELKTKRCVKGWAGWAPVHEVTMTSETVLRDAQDGEGWVLLHDRLVGLLKR